jgi:hypothetical protein
MDKMGVKDFFPQCEGEGFKSSHLQLSELVKLVKLAN